MHILTATVTAVPPPSYTRPPVEDLLRVYLGQSSGSRAPEPSCRHPALDVLDLWDYLGDFA